MVKEKDFKKCDQAGFCRRNRAYADKAAAAGSTWAAPYSLHPDTISFKDGQLQAVILKSINDADTVRLPLTVSFLESGLARVTVDEEKRQNKDIVLRHDSIARKERYNAEELVIVGGTTLDKEAKVASQDTSSITVQYGPSSNFQALIKFSPFSVDFQRDGVTQVRFNEQGWMNMEHWRPKVEKKDGEADAADGEVSTGEDESTWWDESFGGNTDTKPKGPESVALDITFPGYDHVFGIPSHTGPLSLKETRGNADGHFSEPYRMYNADVFEYILDSPMTLYGSIPLMQAHKKDSAVAVFWLNAAETWVDITKSKAGKNPNSLGSEAETNTHTHWISESGLLDIFVFLGPTPKDITKAYGELTGTTAMPQEFSLGYHQCRWNYVSDDDVRDVSRKMDKHKIPYDVIWLDIEYTDEKKYFTTDKDMFGDLKGTGEVLDQTGRKLVVIIDPHIKNAGNYEVVDQLKEKNLAVRNKENSIFDGWCWPGSSHWIDSFNPKAIEWWKGLFKYANFKGTMENTFVWNDMNEPSVFNGPETTMPKDNLHHGDWEHRDVHNLMGITFHNATYQALLSRKPGELRRPFVLTRSFFAGSQRYGAMWTGDNQASWDHLGASVPMILSQGISGFPFAGADVGGFFGNPDKELQTRWYQAGAFYPFFRGHAHIDARRREPYLAGEPYTTIITAALRLRYSLLPAWYTAFFQAHRDGSPIVRPLLWTHPGDEAGLAIDDQFFLGETGLLVKPVVEEGKESADIYIPDDEVYYDYFTYDVLPTKKGKSLSVSAPLEKIPLLMRGGHVVPRRDRPRRSSGLMKYDDYTLVVTIAKDGTAEGELYVDDGDSFDYEKGQYIHRKFTLRDGVISSVDAEGRAAGSVKPGAWMKQMKDVSVDKIIIVGAPAAWDKEEVEVETEGKKKTVPVQYVKGKSGSYAIVGGLGVPIGADWAVRV
ncbi:related to glucosidase II, alpha subunit [Cephalotrichum gorgonifer]|uniref:alpha-glucosidase n=1 Tax=Cephalotrichum gorgonifer TaxID=2041049 RepID=A0AAE8N6H3_9PEZI|nr:related to glucosidase II, alpha subunit [Cephalotrichum gorgonifer]